MNCSLILTTQRVHNEYTSEGWTKHHTQMLKYEETSVENPKPSITFEVADPADDMEKKWKVTIISVVHVSYNFSFFFFCLGCLISLLHGLVSLYVLYVTQFEKSVVDQLTEEHNIPVTSFGIQWLGSSDTTLYKTVRKIKLLGMKGPDNYFSIFLPKKVLPTEKSTEGTCTHTQCTHAYKLVYSAMISL